MAGDDEVFRSRKKVNPEEIQADPLAQVKHMQEMMAQSGNRDNPMKENDSPFTVTGNIPPDFQQILNQRKAQAQQIPQGEIPLPNIQGMPMPNAPKPQSEIYEPFEAPPERKRNIQPPTQSGSGELDALLKKLAERHMWEEFEFASKGKFYANIPPVIHVRPMTGGEEQILATPRYVKKGKAVDMIFQRCIQETIPTEQLLSADRTHLLIYLRGISYTPDYDVEIKCPACGTKFSTTIDLNDLEVEVCPDDFASDELAGVLPTSGFRYVYRLATGADEQEISQYREKRIQQWGDQSDDDTLLYRTALLLEEIEGVTSKKELAVLLKKLPINDVAHLRNMINEPPFGVNTEVMQVCPSCSEEFEIDLPLDANFFFPRKKEGRTQA